MGYLCPRSNESLERLDAFLDSLSANPLRGWISPRRIEFAMRRAARARMAEKQKAQGMQL